MTTSTLAFGKASAFGASKALSSLASKSQSRYYGNPAAPRNNAKPLSRTVEDHSIQRELFMNVLNANATKRDAKQYLSRFKPSKKADAKASGHEERNARHQRDQDRLDSMGVNLGGLYAPARAIAQSPQFVREHVNEKPVAPAQEIMHVALVSLRSPESLDEETLDGLAITIGQLVKLDMRILLAVDCTDLNGVHYQDTPKRKALLAEQGERLVRVISHHSRAGARFISDALSCSDSVDSTGSSGVDVGLPQLLLNPLKRGTVAVVPNVAYSETGHLTSASLLEVMRALTSHFASRSNSTSETEGESCTDPVSLDRIIVLDSTGGIPSKRRGDGAHIFINLQQEFSGITEELSCESSNGNGNGISKSTYRQHLANLEMTRQCLALLPSASSAVIISPREAAISSRSRAPAAEPLTTGTRQRKNTLIHNLLTNKPIVSSSLPLARLPSNGASSPSLDPTATLLKKGMPVTIIPAAHPQSGWTAPESGTTALDLRTDPRVNFPRLLHLIEDSFRRKLDVDHYFSRIAGRTAGLIVAGDYEGGAILTWESAPSPISALDPARLVPYLDKFAVLQSSQGSAGVADIVFQAMVRTCFPAGVCWRSRNDNPVNKWYFERAAGTWTIPESNWTMFWTGGGVVEDRRRWEEYVGVCRSVVPSWADKGKKAD